MQLASALIECASTGSIPNKCSRQDGLLARLRWPPGRERPTVIALDGGLSSMPDQHPQLVSRVTSMVVEAQ